MGNIVHLSQKKQERDQKKLHAKKKQPDAQTIRLWRLSMEIDDLIKKGVLDDSLPPDEIAAILAHRLGTLISCCEKPIDLSKFCCNIIERMNSNCITGEPA
ncbi:hypothetical protein [Silvanigrella aquatica]|uniref:Uncharacterized protein n=1 Tax=Silvanigrella aquatica TaxID=1915309 RepID=A0A1L4D0Q9_9BACT|nr:hypothetical protein [Silvanigrella aquatica]APJ03760.1 hypothetical protein AXG55_07515 [Silvanigrella aquatica]